jgi:hypothetical protein
MNRGGDAASWSGATRGAAPHAARPAPGGRRPRAPARAPPYAVTCGWRETSTISCGSVTIVSMIP